MNIYKAEQLAKSLMNQHGLAHYRFKWTNHKRVCGQCNNSKMVISLSKPITELNDAEQVRNTILHEIAHALTPRHGHDRVWQRVAILIGCDGNRLASPDTVTPEKKWHGFCKYCDTVAKRYRLTRSTKEYTACGNCCRTHNNGKFSDKYLFVWKKVR